MSLVAKTKYMVQIGNFFFKHRNWLFIFFYGALFIPSWPIVSKEKCGVDYLWWPIITGLIVTIGGQLIRGLTIGLAYIVRGGREGKPYAEGLVTDGIFNHCRNPLYVGNILMLLGVGILANSLLYVAVVIPVFLFIYQAIVLAEEDFLRKKFGSGFDEYCKKVNRWFPDFRGLGKTLSSMEFKWKRWILKSIQHNIYGWQVLFLFYYYVTLNLPAMTKQKEIQPGLSCFLYSAFFIY